MTNVCINTNQPDVRPEFAESKRTKGMNRNEEKKNKMPKTNFRFSKLTIFICVSFAVIFPSAKNSHGMWDTHRAQMINDLPFPSRSMWINEEKVCKRVNIIRMTESSWIVHFRILIFVLTLVRNAFFSSIWCIERLPLSFAWFYTSFFRSAVKYCRAFFFFKHKMPGQSMKWDQLTVILYVISCSHI